MRDIGDVFDAKPKSHWDFMTEREQCFYIPAYQRHYSWSKEHIERLVEDTAHGVLLLPDQNDSIKFLGTIIAINDKQHQTIDPKVKDELPPKVMTIIDGQQRLSTMLLVNCVLHNEITSRSIRFENATEPAHKWLYESAFDSAKNLSDTLEIDRGRGDCRYYPKIIRAFVDQWSRKKDEARYSSPLGYYLMSYCNHSRADDARYVHKIPDCEGEDRDYHEYVDKVHKIIRRVLTKGVAQQGIDDRFLVPSFNDLLSSKHTQEALFLSEFPQDVKEFLVTKKEHSPENKNFSELLRLICFANYFLRRVCVTIVTADSEDYAFDMFEALNTTGEPLTAFETFKPSIIKAESMENYRDSPSHKLINNIDSYLRRYSDTTKRHRATSDLLIPFSLAENGTKLSKRLSEQRRVLRDSFESTGQDLESKREFVEHLSNATTYIRGAWEFEKSQGPTIPGCPRLETDELKLCLDFLKQAKHSITQSLLIRFYSQIRKSYGEDKLLAEEHFSDAVKAVTAFFVLWRGSRSSTGGIDSVYREIMSTGIEDLGVGAFSRNPRTGSKETPCSRKLTLCLRHFLEGKGAISSKEDWVRKASRTNVYDMKQVARFILISAFDDVVPDAGEPGLVKRGRQNISRSLTYLNWTDEACSTLEHIAPQRPTNDWPPELYEAEGIVHSLGNFTLLPAAENSSIGNRTWAQKRTYYSILSSESAEEVDQKIIAAEGAGWIIPEQTKELLKRSRYLPYLAALSDIEGNWMLEIVQKRSTRIAELCWERISPWLGY